MVTWVGVGPTNVLLRHGLRPLQVPFNGMSDMQLHVRCLILATLSLHMACPTCSVMSDTAGIMSDPGKGSQFNILTLR